MRIITLRDENAGAHCHAAVTSVGAVSIDTASCADRFKRGLGAADQFLDRDREEGAVYRAEPKGGNGLMVRIRFGSTREAHVDDETHTEFTQSFVVADRWRIADKEVVGNLRKVHVGNGNIFKTFFTLCKAFPMLH